MDSLSDHTNILALREKGGFIPQTMVPARARAVASAIKTVDEGDKQEQECKTYVCCLSFYQSKEILHRIIFFLKINLS
jgi:hypothetical protein